MKSKTFITGISDFHALNTSILKLTYVKGNPEIKFCRDQNFNNDLFQVDLENGLRSLTEETCISFEGFFFLRTLDYHPPLKNKILRVPENFLTSKAFRKTLMMRFRMKNLYLKNTTY